MAAYRTILFIRDSSIKLPYIKDLHIRQVDVSNAVDSVKQSLLLKVQIWSVCFNKPWKSVVTH